MRPSTSERGKVLAGSRWRASARETIAFASTSAVLGRCNLPVIPRPIRDIHSRLGDHGVPPSTSHLLYRKGERCWVGDVAIVAVSRAGELLREMEKAKGQLKRGPASSRDDSGAPTLKALGITRDQSYAWRARNRMIARGSRTLNDGGNLGPANGSFYDASGAGPRGRGGALKDFRLVLVSLSRLGASRGA